MAEKKVGVLIKEARTAAKLSQEKLAAQAGEGLTGAMISKCERGEADLTNAQLKSIAKACGVTQSSLLNAPKNTAEKKTTAAKSSTAKATSAKTSSAKTSSAAKKASSTAATTSEKVTAAEKKLLDAYRNATSDAKKIALKVLKGEYNETITNLLSSTASSSASSAITDGLSNMVQDFLGGLLGK